MAASRKDRQLHRKTGIECFNHAWDYLDKKKRTANEDLQMLTFAHASRYHWALAGKPRNLAISDWQLSRVYAAVGEPGLSLKFARSSLAICKKNSLNELVHTANEAMARAYAVSKDFKSARVFLRQARDQLDRLTIDKKERDLYLSQMAETEALVEKHR